MTIAVAPDLATRGGPEGIGDLLPPWLEGVRARVLARRSAECGPERASAQGDAVSSRQPGVSPATRSGGETATADAPIALVTPRFLECWAPRLGPTLTAIVIQLRAMAAGAPAGEDRSWRTVSPSQSDLARRVGVSEITIQRELRRPEAEAFVRRVPRSGYDAGRQRRIRLADAHAVRVDDPQVPVGGQADPCFDRFDLQTAGLAPSGSRSDAALTLNVKRMRIEMNDVNAADPIVEPRGSDRIREIADRLVEELGDPGSGRFYARVARICPESLIWTALSETKDAHLTGRIRRSRGACFTDRILRMARARGLAL